MTCPAAVNACRDKLTEPKTAEQVFREIRWWVKISICEALLELQAGDEIEVAGTVNGETVYQRAK